MNNYKIIITSFFLFCATFSFGQYSNVTEALKEINTTLQSINVEMTCDDKGNATKTDVEFNVIYEFNLNNVEIIQTYKEGPSNMVQFICASGKQCFYCDKNEGEGIFHFINVGDLASAEKIVLALKYIKRETSMY